MKWDDEERAFDDARRTSVSSDARHPAKPAEVLLCICCERALVPRPGGELCRRCAVDLESWPIETLELDEG